MNEVNSEAKPKRYIWEFDNTINGIDDWVKKYEGTFVLFNGQPTLVSIFADCTTLHNTKFKSHIVPDGTEVDIKPFFPKSQWLIYKDVPMYFVRRPERQYRRSFNKECYNVLYPQDPKGKPLLYNASILIDSIKNTKIVPFTSAIDKLTTPNVIDKDFCLFKTGKETFKIVGMYGTIAIGRRDTKQIWTKKDQVNIVNKLLDRSTEWKISSLTASTD